MLSPIAEQLTEQFYEWEMLGRGWLYAEEPIELEAPFTPFFGHFPWQESSVNTYRDDGIRHTFFSRLASFFKAPKAETNSENAILISHEPFPFDDDDRVRVWQLGIQKDVAIKQTQVEQWLSMLSYSTIPMSVEFVGTRKRITVQVTCRESDEAYFKAQFQTYFPKLALIEGDDCLAFEQSRGSWASVDYGLAQEFTRPLVADKNADPLIGLFTLLEHVGEQEMVCFQVLFNGVVNNWHPSILRAVSGNDGDSFFYDAPTMPALAKQKTSKQLLAATARCCTLAPTEAKADELMRQVSFVLKRAFIPSSNSLLPLASDEYTLSQRLNDISTRTSHRLGMLLNTEELSCLIELPEPPYSEKLLGRNRKTKLPPAEATGHPFVIGWSEAGGERRDASISTEERLRHMHIIGATGTGKSTLLTSMIVQDIRNGNGVAVLDPHGDLIETILQYIPERRLRDVVLLDPSDSEYPVGFNILQAHTEIESETLSSDLVGAFKRLSTSWGDQMHSVLSNALLAMLQSSRGGTLIDLRRFLLETGFRNEFLQTVEDYSIRYYWQKQYPLLKSTSIGPILTRLDHFLRSRLVRNMVAQKQSLDVGRILDTQKILLVKLSQGLIGEENAYLLGSFIVSKIHQAALARQATKERKDFFFYIDEFQHFITPSMAAILSGARKYHLGLILAHQDLQQISRTDSDVLASLLSNAGTRICFRVGEADAKKLGEGFSFFDASDLQNLSVGEAIGRIEKPAFDFSFDTVRLEPPQASLEYIERIISSSRESYATPRTIVEEALLKSLTPEIKEAPAKREKITVPKPVQEPTESSIPRPAVEKETVLAIPTPVLEQEAADLTKRLVKQKEESQHRYIQNLIKRLAEGKGFKASIEAPVSTGDGRVDVLLERGKEIIACEVSVTTDIHWELHNIQKCLDEGYSTVISCVTDTKTKAKFREHIAQAFSPAEQGRVQVFILEELLAFLDEKTGSKEPVVQTVKGYRVRVQYDGAAPGEQLRKKEAVTKVVANAMKRLKT